MIITYFYQPFPILNLGDIVLRELTEADAENYLNYMARSEMAEYLTKSNRPSNIALALEEVRYWASLFHNKRSFYWAIAIKETNQLIGTVGFNVIYVNHAKAEISYDLDYNFWGKGIMLKSVKAVLKFADFALELIRIQATVITDNQRSIKVLERCGFSKEGLLKKFEIVNKTHKDYYMFSRVN